MLHRLCEPPSIPLSFSLATVLPRRGSYHVSFGKEGIDTPPTQCPSFTARTTRVSNPVCSPSFRTSVSGMSQKVAFATGVPPDIYAFHRYTRNSTFSSHPQARQFGRQFHGCAMGFHPPLTSPPTCSLCPVIPSNACHLRLTAAAGTKLAVASSQAFVKAPGIDRRFFLTCDSSLQPEGLHPARGVAPSDFRPLRKILDWSLP